MQHNVLTISFPANDFGQQEPASNGEIKMFYQNNYGVSLIVNEKVSVNGKVLCPLFRYLTSTPNPDFTGEIKWNFEKFLIDEDGKLIHRFRSDIKPLDPILTQDL